MVFNCDDLPKNSFEKFKEFLSERRNFQEVYEYYRSHNLQKASKQPAVYCFSGLNGKKYVGKSDDIFKRINVYLKLNGAYINYDLKDDIIKYGRNFFTFTIYDTFLDEKINFDNIIDAENFYTSRHAQNSIMYNKINTTLNLGTTVRKGKNFKKAYEKLNKNNPDDFAGFGDIFE